MDPRQHKSTELFVDREGGKILDTGQAVFGVENGNITQLEMCWR